MAAVHCIFYKSITILGLRNGHIPEAKVVGPAVGARELDVAHGPSGPALGQGHLEAGGLLPQRQRGQLPVCDSTKCPDQNSPKRRHFVHFEVSRCVFQIILLC